MMGLTPDNEVEFSPEESFVLDNFMSNETRIVYLEDRYQETVFRCPLLYFCPEFDSNGDRTYGVMCWSAIYNKAQSGDPRFADFKNMVSFGNNNYYIYRNGLRRAIVRGDSFAYPGQVISIYEEGL